jgi:hypothetical protein
VKCGMLCESDGLRLVTCTCYSLNAINIGLDVSIDNMKEMNAGKGRGS